MKLATYQDGSSDGQLVVVSQDLSQAHFATHIAHHMRQLFDDWNFIAPQLEDLYAELNRGKAPYPFAFDPSRCMTPLPRPNDYLQGNAYERVVHSDADLSVASVSSSALAFPVCELKVSSQLRGLDFEVGTAFLVDTIEQGSSPEHATACVRLVGIYSNLVNRSAMVARAGGLLNYSSLLASCVSPVVISGDELGSSWENGKLHLRLDLFLNGQPIARCPTDDEGCWGIGELLSNAASPHRIRAGSLFCSGSLVHQDESKGYTSLLLKFLRERDALSQDFISGLKAGDQLRLEVKGKDGLSLFGSITMLLTE